MRWHRRIAGIGVVVLLVSQFSSGAKLVGYSYEVKNGETLVRGGSHPLAFFWAFFSIVLYTWAIREGAHSEPAGTPGLGRRFLAFLTDFYLGLLLLTSISTFIPLSLEALRTGRFEWSFERDYSVPSDHLVGVPMVFVTMGLLLLYFAYPLTKGTQTPGCYVMRTKVSPPFGETGRFTLRQAIQRTVYEFLGLCSWPPLVFSKRDPDGRTWYDKRTACRVVLVDSPPRNSIESNSPSA